MDAYRSSWRGFCSTFYDQERNVHLSDMDRIFDILSEDYGINNDSFIWKSFIKTLSGYQEYQESSSDRLMANLRESGMVFSQFS
jgi:hypothetical protein